MTMNKPDDHGPEIEPLECYSWRQEAMIKRLAREAHEHDTKAEALYGSAALKSTEQARRPLEASALVQAGQSRIAREELARKLLELGYRPGTLVDCGGLVAIVASGAVARIYSKLPDFPAEALDSIDEHLAASSDRDELAERSVEFSEMVRVD